MNNQQITKKMKFPAILGAILLIIGIYSTGNAALFVLTSEKAEGTIVEYRERVSDEGDISFAPVFRYEINGETYLRSANVHSSFKEFAIGQTVTVAYKPDQPQNARLRGVVNMFLGPFIFLLMGAVFSSLSIGFLVTQKKRKKIIEKLKKDGSIAISGVCTGTKEGRRKVNNQQSYHILVQINDVSNNTVRIVQSDVLWFDPVMHVRKGQPVQVLVDPANSKNYWVDISFLPSHI